MISDFGEKLKKIRQKKKINLDIVEEKTQIQKKYLKAIEDCDYKNLPGQIYARNFVKEYCLFLGIEAQVFLDQLANDYDIIERELKNENHNYKKNMKSYKGYGLMSVLNPAFYKNVIVGLIFIFCFTYLGVEAKSVFDPPMLEVISPINNTVINERLVEIKGKTESETNLFINDKQVLTDNDGNFSENISLQSGVNILKISASKKYSKTNIIYKKVLVVEE